MNVTMGYYNDPNSQIYSQLGSTGGAAIGTYFGGPVGGAIGGALGGTLGGLLGGGKKKQKMKIFPIGSKENPGWPGVGSGSTLNLGSMGASPPNSALAGGAQGAANGASIGNQFGGGASGGAGGPLAGLFGGSGSMPYDHPATYGSDLTAGNAMNSQYFNSLFPPTF